ncbi:glycosyltransferase family 2 protein [Paenibacillus dendritiformis]|uniref:glycosyltransferase family 2 protein n=1 Tax=Paenibacillus dendritiformis TaxID=130049 RepID=UPI0020C2A463|nr:glycosyltransferase family 2 protein [Paenibacillus dendritiformis]CAH8768224.1 glycosyltransferase family 2 protein [Paenibacillus dendritiformis]
MRTLTVFTPAYNRAYCLTRLYDSLVRQNSGEFEWLVIDDGSTDETPELVRAWIADNRIPIRYVRQENQGMHGAHNTAYDQIETELNVCIDSDDYMPDGAVEKIIDFWRTYGSDQVAGIVGLDCALDGTVIGTRLPEDKARSTLFDLYYKHGVTGDKKLVYRTKLTKMYRYPLFEGEKYVGLAYKYYMIDRDYELLLMNEVLCYVEYMPDGASRNMLRHYRNNPRGFAFYRVQLMKLPFAGLSFKFRQAVHHVSSCCLARSPAMLLESPAKLLTLLALLPGFALYVFIVAKT